jgi:pyruvate-ferredoxin/flavodoxin oxidoreductase
MGMRVAIDKQTEYARELLGLLSGDVGGDFAMALLSAGQSDEADIYEQRKQVALLKQKLATIDKPEAKRLLDVADYLVKKSMWIIGGDGWAYDIGYGGLDHVLASGKNVNVLVLDTEVYSNTGGQMSKATPRGAVAKFAAGGKPVGKKDLGMMAMNYGNVYVAQVAMGANDTQTLRAFIEAEAYEGPSLIIAYSHCIAHGINMGTALQNQKAAAQSGHWMLYRYNPEKTEAGENPLTLDSRKPRIPMKDYMYMENRYKMLTKSNPKVAKELLAEAQADADARWEKYNHLATHGFSENGSDQ